MDRSIILSITLLWGLTICFTTHAEYGHIELIPNARQTISPFLLQSDSEDSLELVAFCPKMTKESIKVESEPNLCDNIALRGTAEELNAILANFTVTFESKKNAKSMPIYYFVSDPANSRKVKRFTQNLSALTEIPITVSKEVILYDVERSANLSEHLIQIDPAYISSRGALSFSVETQSSEIPSWISFELINGDLVLKGKPEKKTPRDLSLAFRIVDDLNGLKSPEIKTTIAFVRSSSSSALFIGFVVFFVTIISLVIVMSLVCVVKSRVIIEKSMMLDQTKRPRETEEPNVLTESIVNWNNTTHHKLMTQRISIMGLVAHDRTTINDSMHELEILKHDFGSGQLLENANRNIRSDDSMKLIHENSLEEISKIEDYVQNPELDSPDLKLILGRPSLS